LGGALSPGHIGAAGDIQPAFDPENVLFHFEVPAALGGLKMSSAR
jgi:hypothetical protein